MTLEGTVRYIDLILIMVASTVAKERFSESEFRNSLLFHMGVLHNYHGLVGIYLPMMNNIVLANLGQHVSAVIPLTWIAIFQVLGLALFYNTHLELAEQENRGVTQHFGSVDQEM